MSRAIRGKDGKVWGVLDGTEYRTARKFQHLCIKHNGYGIQKDLLDALDESGVKIITVETPRGTFRTHIETWKVRGIYDTLREQDGLQVFLPLDIMRGRGKDCRTLDEYM